jgi:NAD+ kinase|tara:strand:+ start:491 stop:1324 length:834 start_codon:yes stop_codon:yes gene_type:complete
LKKIGILYHPVVEAAHTKAAELRNFLVSQGISTWLCSAWEEEEARSRLVGTDLIISVGGDGTILRATHVALPETTPITGVNLGRLGFMTEINADEALEILPSLLAGKGWIDERAMLEVEVSFTDPKLPSTFHALNDVVVARGAVARLVQIEASVNSQPLASYKADGLIAATATGSTAYSLAAGGPIFYPQSSDFLLVPITPHLSPAYTIVLPATAVVQLRLTAVYPATLSIDGHISQPLPDGATVTVKHSPNTTRFLRIHPETDFYRSLEQKLKGKQ